MKIAVVTLTKGAFQLGIQLTDSLEKADFGIESVLYGKEDFVSEYKKEGQVLSVRKPFKNFVGDLFQTYDGLVFVMATGIVVRSIAPFIQSKVSDPAVVVMDEAGQYAISLLSGHLGGGNALTESVACAIGAKPVITTASDVTGHLAVDMFAKSLGMEIESMEAAKNMTALGINGKSLALFTDIHLSQDIMRQVESMKIDVCPLAQMRHNEGHKKYAGGIILSSSRLSMPENTVQLIPKHFTVGIGCRKDTPYKTIQAVFSSACQKAGIREESVRKLATIQLKANENGIMELVQTLNVPLEIIELEAIKEVQTKFQGSDFVEKTIGVRAVAEPCAMLSGEAGHMRLYRYADQGVTIAIWEEDNAIKR